jgi:leader peptidase (prepilin peptidase)/N-methyltransferase
MLPLISIFSYLLIFALLLALAYRDLKDYILPNRLNAALALTYLSFHITTRWALVQPVDILIGGIAGGGFLLVIRFISEKFYKQDSLGLGDVKMMAAAGLGLGYPNILLALSLGAFAGLFHGLYIAYSAKKGNKSGVSLGQVNVPAGFGLAIGIAAVTASQFGFEWFKIK